ncbi:hypothetical protein AOQ84DRAFT_388776 [Glonium stellatum]|uniref:Uncharacterized protein n=1 Tax=Glonium stellatum TaxID=574774 RepID=A0A8E2F0Y1_9PEZI|nr:hypothetical protein AOQ84DRAFT_388776 [Glonium stellatum]
MQVHMATTTPSRASSAAPGILAGLQLVEITSRNLLGRPSELTPCSNFYSIYHKLTVRGHIVRTSTASPCGSNCQLVLESELDITSSRASAPAPVSAETTPIDMVGQTPSSTNPEFPSLGPIAASRSISGLEIPEFVTFASWACPFCAEATAQHHYVPARGAATECVVDEHLERLGEEKLSEEARAILDRQLDVAVDKMVGQKEDVWEQARDEEREGLLSQGRRCFDPMDVRFSFGDQ